MKKIIKEPGYYKEKFYGFRIENCLLIIETKRNFLGFENLTLFPYEKKLIDLNILEREDIEFINLYHKKVLELFY